MVTSLILLTWQGNSLSPPAFSILSPWPSLSSQPLLHSARPLHSQLRAWYPLTIPSPLLACSLAASPNPLLDCSPVCHVPNLLLGCSPVPYSATLAVLLLGKHCLQAALQQVDCHGQANPPGHSPWRGRARAKPRLRGPTCCIAAQLAFWLPSAGPQRLGARELHGLAGAAAESWGSVPQDWECRCGTSSTMERGSIERERGGERSTGKHLEA